MTQWTSNNQLSGWVSHHPTEKGQQARNNKSMLICFLDQNGIIHKDFVNLCQSMKNSKWRFWDTCRRTCGRSNQTSERQRPGSFTTTMCLQTTPPSKSIHYHLLTTWLLYKRPQLNQNQHSATSFSSQNWKLNWRDKDSRQWRGFRLNYKEYKERCERTTSRDASSFF